VIGGYWSQNMKLPYRTREHFLPTLRRASVSYHGQLRMNDQSIDHELLRLAAYDTHGILGRIAMPHCFGANIFYYFYFNKLAFANSIASLSLCL
jgi:hypothetical protein